MQVTDLIRYNHVVRGLYFDAMAKLPWCEVVAPRGLSYDCMRDVFLHLTYVEEWGVCALSGKPLKWAPPDFNIYQDFDSLKKYVLQVQAKTETYLAQLSSEELNREIDVFWSQVPNTRITVETRLTSIVMEDMIHYGELSASFWQMGLDAPYWGYWRYKVQHSETGGDLQVTDLIRYNHLVRGLYFDAFAKLPWYEVAANKGLSFDSMRNVFLHLTYVEDRWISCIIPGRLKEIVEMDFDVFKDLEALKNYMQQTAKNTENYLAKLSAEELKREVVVPWGDKPRTKITVETGLTHMVIEDMIHYGELSAALWQMGLDAPYLGFWRYKYQNP
jgi:uncharacterized damage-inducible protein DinB